MKIIKDMVFENQAIRLDGNDFTNCTFENADLEYNGSEPATFKSCCFIDCQWVFVGPAQNTLNFMATLYGMGLSGRHIIETAFPGICSRKFDNSGECAFVRSTELRGNG